ncbi:MAG: UbiD family decarboxylase [Hydrogenibacillus schlegelii]|nr:UbiD family decarboxylase [Hydrogenibacillus schlegelii]
MHANLRSFLQALEADGELVRIAAPVDPKLELAEIHRRVVAEGGPALWFERVKGSPYPVVTNLFGTPHRLERAFGRRPEALVRRLVEALPALFSPSAKALWNLRDLAGELLFRTGLKMVPPEKAPVAAVRDDDFDLTTLPALTSWPEDGGPFLTLPLVYTEHPETKAGNLGIYRMQIFGPRTTGMHWQIHKGGGFHHHVAEARGEPLPATVFLGGPPALIVAAVAPLPEGVPELLFASLLLGGRLARTRVDGAPHPLVAEAEFALVGEVPPHERAPEGPFGDHYGYYSLVHDFPVFHLKRVFLRKDALFPATVVGKPVQEDYWIGEYLQRLLQPLFPIVMPGVRDLWSYAETGFHALAGAVVRESYSREALAHALRILGEGQLTLTKFLLVTDAPVDLRDARATFTAVLSRFRPERDLVIFAETAMDTLDYTGRRFNHGSKAILLGTGDPVRTLPAAYDGPPLPGAAALRVFSPGILVLSGRPYAGAEDWPRRLLAEAETNEALRAFPLVVLVDDARAAVRDQSAFLWTVFTRFDPAYDLHAPTIVGHNRLGFALPIVIDARMKPFYPGTVEPDPETKALVDRRWTEYFPGR